MVPAGISGHRLNCFCRHVHEASLAKTFGYFFDGFLHHSGVHTLFSSEMVGNCRLVDASRVSKDTGPHSFNPELGEEP
ncbi:hypothetical protein BLJAPNOD_05171 [Ensifer sp. M14]|nr:hypothetical protein BLJAPNOD_05171 [Ensifer sp. M14]